MATGPEAAAEGFGATTVADWGVLAMDDKSVGGGVTVRSLAVAEGEMLSPSPASVGRTLLSEVALFAPIRTA